jgi:hypothetical protein
MWGGFFGLATAGAEGCGNRDRRSLVAIPASGGERDKKRANWRGRGDAGRVTGGTSLAAFLSPHRHTLLLDRVLVLR